MGSDVAKEMREMAKGSREYRSWEMAADRVDVEQAALEAENERLREALKFYADRTSWQDYTVGDASGRPTDAHDALEDGGNVAREALASGGSGSGDGE